MGWQQLSPRSRPAFLVGALASFALGWVPMVGAAAAFATPWIGLRAAAGSALAAMVLGLVWSVWMPWLSHGRWAWWLRERDLLVAQGVIIRSVVSIPLDRVQHVDLQQGVFDRMFGVQDVLVYTASGRQVDGVIPGLEPAVAEALRDRLVGATGHDGV